MLHTLAEIEEWKFVFEHPLDNRGAYLIAQSAILPWFMQSYVAHGSSLWLLELFDDEKSFASV